MTSCFLKPEDGKTLQTRRCGSRGVIHANTIIGIGRSCDRRGPERDRSPESPALLFPERMSGPWYGTVETKRALVSFCTGLRGELCPLSSERAASILTTDEGLRTGKRFSPACTDRRTPATGTSLASEHHRRWVLLGAPVTTRRASPPWNAKRRISLRHRSLDGGPRVITRCHTPSHSCCP